MQKSLMPTPLGLFDLRNRSKRRGLTRFGFSAFFMKFFFFDYCGIFSISDAIILISMRVPSSAEHNMV